MWLPPFRKTNISVCYPTDDSLLNRAENPPFRKTNISVCYYEVAEDEDWDNPPFRKTNISVCYLYDGMKTIANNLRHFVKQTSACVTAIKWGLNT